uniref:Tyrosine 3-monooxygenase/tryptophan 5-monooxygenase activation protein n=1 Tax=Placidida sp. TaxID=2810146 RepID=A0A8E8U7D9_9STRA|nr:tyrosine 3-monooxygenase/tryptophan 5-monooxygenase activation protein [Placidida sp.]
MSSKVAEMPADEAIYMAKVSEQAERYEEMVQYITRAADVRKNLAVEERNLLSVAYKNFIGARRASWRVLCSIEDKETGRSRTDRASLVKKYRVQVEDEIRDICKNVVELLGMLLSNVQGDDEDVEAVVFYRKMEGDYWRYFAEFANGDEKDRAMDKAQVAYQQATEAASRLQPTNPIRLGLALNFSVFYYEIMGKNEEACTLAKQAFDDAVSELDDLSEESYKDATLIMQLLRDNLTLWTSDSAADAPVEQDGTAVEDA